MSIDMNTTNNRRVFRVIDNTPLAFTSIGRQIAEYVYTNGALPADAEDTHELLWTPVEGNPGAFYVAMFPLGAGPR